MNKLAEEKISTVTPRLDSLSKLFTESWRSYRERFAVLTAIYALPMLLVAISQLLARAPMPAVWVYLQGLFTLVISLIGEIGLVFAVSRGTKIMESYRRTIAVIWPLLWLALLDLTFLIGGFILLLIPGLILYVRFVFSRYVFVDENKRGLAVLEQSREYTRDYWWPIFFRILILFVPLVAINFFTNHFLGRTISIIEGGILGLFFAPFYVAYTYAIYKNRVALRPNLETNPSSMRTPFFIVCAVVTAMLAVVLVTFALAPKPQPVTWHRYHSDDGQFEILLPGVANGELVTISLPDNQSTTQEMYYGAFPGGAVYYVGFATYPTTIDVSNPGALLKFSMNDFVRSVDGSVVTSSITAFGNGTAVTYLISQSNGTYAKGEDILIRRNFYRIFDNYNLRDYNANDYQTFIRSFQLISISESESSTEQTITPAQIQQDLQEVSSSLHELQNFLNSPS
jgi:hypothetical protein